jgi:hypothetical protein
MFRVYLKKSSRGAIDDANEQISLHSSTPDCTNEEQDNMPQDVPENTLQLISISANDVAPEAIKTDVLKGKKEGRQLYSTMLNNA